ncbi:hypothetical protein, partial [Corynebacterium durum]|uniref:hypothetical protein n=1 Tax=Corynebacterium durum TaxID=61592 RepID=UPI0026DACF6F
HLAKVRVASSSLVIRSGSSAIAIARGGAFCMSAGLIDTTMMHEQKALRGNDGKIFPANSGHTASDFMLL